METMKVQTKNAAVTIKLADQSIISGMINLAGGRYDAQRLSEFLTKDKENPFLTVYKAYVSDDQGDEDVFVNKANILWIKPDRPKPS